MSPCAVGGLRAASQRDERGEGRQKGGANPPYERDSPTADQVTIQPRCICETFVCPIGGAIRLCRPVRLYFHQFLAPAFRAFEDELVLAGLQRLDDREPHPGCAV